MSTELKRCPFCGYEKPTAHEGISNITYFMCGESPTDGGCGAVVSFRAVEMDGLSNEEAIAAWNRRGRTN